MRKIIIAIAIFFTGVCCLSAADAASKGAPTPSTSSVKTAPIKSGVPASAKFLSVDITEVYSKYNKAIEAQEKFNQAAENAQKEINDMIQEGIKLGETYKDLQVKANNPALTEEARKKFLEESNQKIKAIEEKQIQISEYQQQASQALAQRRESVTRLHLNDMQEVCSRIAKSKGANLVINTSGILVMYHDETTDITQEAINALNGQK